MEKNHSGIGIASFLASLFSGFVLLALIAIGGVLELSSPNGIDEESKEAILLGVGLLGACGIVVVAFAMGIACLLQENRKKTFGILGHVFSSLIMLGVLGLVVLAAID